MALGSNVLIEPTQLSTISRCPIGPSFAWHGHDRKEINGYRFHCHPSVHPGNRVCSRGRGSIPGARSGSNGEWRVTPAPPRSGRRTRDTESPAPPVTEAGRGGAGTSPKGARSGYASGVKRRQARSSRVKKVGSTGPPAPEAPDREPR
ncbi:hypothetical protein GCM10027160_02570 [Streptomyces calidiresistens]